RVRCGGEVSRALPCRGEQGEAEALQSREAGRPARGDRLSQALGGGGVVGDGAPDVAEAQRGKGFPGTVAQVAVPSDDLLEQPGGCLVSTRQGEALGDDGARLAFPRSMADRPEDLRGTAAVGERLNVTILLLQRDRPGEMGTRLSGLVAELPVQAERSAVLLIGLRIA